MATFKGKQEADSVEAQIMEMHHTTSRRRLEALRSSMRILGRWSQKAEKVYLMNVERLPDPEFDGEKETGGS